MIKLNGVERQHSKLANWSQLHAIALNLASRSLPSRQLMSMTSSTPFVIWHVVSRRSDADVCFESSHSLSCTILYQTVQSHAGRRPLSVWVHHTDHQESLDTTDISSYRPISNLSAVLQAMSEHLQAVDLVEFKLILLNLTAAFDTVDRDILQHHLQQTLTLTGKCASLVLVISRWLDAVLSDHSSPVCCAVCRRIPSGAAVVHFVHLWPHPTDWRTWHGTTSVCWWHWSQQLCRPSNVSVFSSTISDCLSIAIASWIKLNRLQSNSWKTEVMWCATSWRQHILHSTCVGTVSRLRHLLRRWQEHDKSRRANRVVAFRQLWQIRHNIPPATF